MNLILAKRGARVEKVPYPSIECKLVRDLCPGLPTHAKDGSLRVPSQQRVRQWEKEHPDFPERALKMGLVAPDEVHPLVRPYLNGTAPAARPRSARGVGAPRQ